MGTIEDRRQSCKDWRKRNAERVRAYRKAWYAERPNYNTEWRKNNPAYNRQWHSKHPEYSREYYRKNKEVYKARYHAKVSAEFIRELDKANAMIQNARKVMI